MLNDDVYRAATDKQTHKHIHKKQTYRVKTEETLFAFNFFLLFSFKKAVSNKLADFSKSVLSPENKNKIY